MQKRYYISLLILILITGTSGRGVYAEWIPAIPPAPGEEVRLYTDRNLYVVEEELFFAVTVSPPELPDGAIWSQVAYVELIRWDGSKLAQVKVPVNDGLAEGSLTIPGNLVSGNYYLRAYTKWMRNYSPYRYTYVNVKVINPKRRSIDPGPPDDAAPAPEPRYFKSAEQTGVKISMLEAAAGRRMAVEAEVSLPEGTGSDHTLVMVRRKIDGTEMKSRCFRFNTNDTVPAGDPAFLPEIYGLSVSGRIVEAGTDEPVAGAKVNLSSYSTSFYFSTTRTGKDGFFVFTLPDETGARELHLAEEGELASEHELLITSAFCNKPVRLPYEPFSLNNEEQTAAEDLLLNAQLSARFRSDREDDETSESEQTPFYGTPVSTTYVKEYIELIDLREFFFELVQPVLVNHNNKEPYLVLNTQGSLALYPPLVLMDNIPVENGGRLLEIPSSRISRIEVVNKGYLVNNTRYSGIISIFSEQRDMAGLEMDETHHFFNFNFFSIPHTGLFPAYDQLGEVENIPDLRNLLYWNAGLQLSPGETGRVHFYTGDVPGRYEVVVRTLGDDGNVMTGRSEFVVE